MEYPGVEVMLDREMPHTRHKGMPQRSIIGPSRKHFVDRRVMDSQLALGVVRDREALPLHPRIQDPHNEMKDAMIPQCARRSTLGGAAGKAANLVGCESPRRQLPDSDG